MKNLKATLLLTLVFQLIAAAQQDVLIDTNTTSSARRHFKENLIINTIENNLKLPLNEENEKNWMAAFWGMELILYKNKNIESSLRTALNDYENRSENFNRAAFEAAYTLFTDEMIIEHENILKQSVIPKHFAMAFNYLQRSKSSAYDYNSFERLVKTNFPDWRDNPILFMLYQKLLEKQNKIYRPSLVELLKHDFAKSDYVFFSIQRKNRDYPGILLIRNADGKFMRNNSGSIFHVSQLARSISNLPGYLTNGNTPQGIFSIQGIDTSNNYFIGRTPNVQLVLPYEAEAKKFFHSEDSLEWSENLYKTILPLSWQNYSPIYEAFYAGKAGRNEIIAHGTTIDLDFYAGKPYYPHTPTLGCLCTTEIWDEVDGKRIYSGQAELIQEMNKHGINKGFFVVVEIDDKESPVTLSDVLLDILHAEKYFVK